MISSVENVGKIISATKRYFIEAEIETIVGESFDELYLKFGYANEYNDPENHFVKNLFQKLAPMEVRKSLLDEIFRQFVQRSESSWVDEFYMTPDDLRKLVDNGMELGVVMGAQESISAFSRILGPLTGGFVWVLTVEKSAPFDYHTAFHLCGILMVLAAIISLKIVNPQEYSSDEE